MQMSVETIHFFTEDIRYTTRQKRKLRDCIGRLIREEGGKVGEVSVILCSDAYLSGLNSRFLNRDYLTDIIAFDYSDKLEGPVVRGELYISLERVKENAHTFSVSLRTEMNRIIIHGLLHLLGMEDDTEANRMAMRERENYYLETIFRL